MLPDESLNPDAPKFNPGDIVYLKWDKDTAARLDPGAYPAIGTPGEIDCKVISSAVASLTTRLPDGSSKRLPYRLYLIISGRGAFLNNIDERLLATPAEKDLLKGEAIYELLEDTELCCKGTKFTKIGEYVSNESLGIFIHHTRFNKIIKLFEKI